MRRCLYWRKKMILPWVQQWWPDLQAPLENTDLAENWFYVAGWSITLMMLNVGQIKGLERSKERSSHSHYVEFEKEKSECKNMILPPFRLAEWSVLHWAMPKRAEKGNHAGSVYKKVQDVLKGLHSYYYRSAGGKLDCHFSIPFMSSSSVCQHYDPSPSLIKYL